MDRPVLYSLSLGVGVGRLGDVHLFDCADDRACQLVVEFGGQRPLGESYALCHQSPKGLEENALAAVFRTKEEQVRRGLEGIAEGAGHPSAKIIRPCPDVGVDGPGQLPQHRREFVADVVEDHVPVRMAGHFVIGQFGGLELELSGIEVPLPAAGILFAEGQVDQSPAAHHRRAHDLFGFGLRVPQALQGDLDVDEWLPDPFLSFLHHPAGVLDGRRLHGADDVVKLVEIELGRPL